MCGIQPVRNCNRRLRSVLHRTSIWSHGLQQSMRFKLKYTEIWSKMDVYPIEIWFPPFPLRNERFLWGEDWKHWNLLSIPQYFGLVPAHPNHRASDARTRRRMRDLVVLNVTTETVHMVLYDVFDYFGYTVIIMSVDTYTHIYVYNVYIYIYI